MVLAMFYRPEGDGPFGGIITPAIVVRVHDSNVIDVVCAAINPNNGVLGGMGALSGLTEVATVAEINAGTPESSNSAFVPGTWCRREVCG
jgi:hypothetical protein